ncbi:alpha/beta fold hydrolase [Streptomyces olivaceoviridis]|uniref:alpha/beta fold hydrolase n=1 Tax=Streptomyces olivaceoviridis TaxID=1921 RepID=UPI00368FF8D7
MIVPALPGFPFAAPVASRGMSSGDMAEAIANAMTELGYERYVVSAGDVGCDVAEALAAARPDRVTALHLTDVSQYRFLVDPPQDLSDAERAYIRRGHHWQAAEGGYSVASRRAGATAELSTRAPARREAAPGRERMSSLSGSPHITTRTTPTSTPSGPRTTAPSGAGQCLFSIPGFE